MSTGNAPARGSREYLARVFLTAQCETLDEATGLLRLLWNDYGWRSTVDVMTEWVCSIDFIVPSTGRYRDFTGTVNPDIWAPLDILGEEKMLAIALRTANERAQRDGTPLHEEFQQAHTITDRLRGNVDAWRKVYSQALRTAHTTREREAVWAVLARGPGIKDRDWLVLRDGAAFLYQIAAWPMAAARATGRAVRAPGSHWDHDTDIPQSVIMQLHHEGEGNVL